MNNYGQVVGYYFDTEGKTRAFLYDPAIDPDWAIDLDAGQAVAPDESCVKTYPVRVENGTIEIDLESAAQRLAPAL